MSIKSAKTKIFREIETDSKKYDYSECGGHKAMVSERFKQLNEISKINKLPIDDRTKESLKKDPFQTIADLNNKMVICEIKCKGRCKIK